jgi:hypothetical protein
MSSQEDRNPASQTYHEWLSATYTLNGVDVYALVHNEWYPSLVDSRCDPNVNWRFRINSITLAASHDGGRTFLHPANYRLFRRASPWRSTYSCNGDRNDAVYGPAEPSNIIAYNGGYYVMFYQGTDPAIPSEWGTCLARTFNVTHADTWMVWTNKGWLDAMKNVCDPVSKRNIGEMRSSITYNTYLGKFVLVGSKQYPFDGVYLSTSDDLIHWDEAVKILPLNDARMLQGEVRYPALLDPMDRSWNFENTGREPFLYLVLQHDDPNSIDIIRQQIIITKSDAQRAGPQKR